jgi:hypothetical protein
MGRYRPTHALIATTDRIFRREIALIFVALKIGEGACRSMRVEPVYVCIVCSMFTTVLYEGSSRETRQGDNARRMGPCWACKQLTGDPSTGSGQAPNTSYCNAPESLSHEALVGVTPPP